MSDQFQHVMVLISIIVGLAITNLLLGLGAAIERISDGRRRLRVGWAFGFWMAYLFIWLVLFWWWEFRLLESIKHWSLWNYFLIVCYAVNLFLLVALLVPRDWNTVDDLDRYLLSKRRWFYPALVLAFIVDLADSYMKGGLAYIDQGGMVTWGLNVAGVPIGIIGFRSTNVRTHAIMAIVLFVWQAVIGFDVFPWLQT